MQLSVALSFSVVFNLHDPRRMVTPLRLLPRTSQVQEHWSGYYFQCSGAKWRTAYTELEFLVVTLMDAAFLWLRPQDFPGESIGGLPLLFQKYMQTILHHILWNKVTENRTSCPQVEHRPLLGLCLCPGVLFSEHPLPFPSWDHIPEDPGLMLQWNLPCISQIVLPSSWHSSTFCTWIRKVHIKPFFGLSVCSTWLNFVFFHSLYPNAWFINKPHLFWRTLSFWYFFKITAEELLTVIRNKGDVHILLNLMFIDWLFTIINTDGEINKPKDQNGWDIPFLENNSNNHKCLCRFKTESAFMLPWSCLFSLQYSEFSSV